jgi:DinB superfamily
MNSLSFPIGEFVYGQAYTADQTRDHIAAIANLPISLPLLVSTWADNRLDTPYRPGGWTVRQVVHHLADSHINAYVRTKLALTENNPTICPYEQDDWANLPDSEMDIAVSLALLQNLHQRWVAILNTLTDEQLARTYYHPGAQRTFALREVIANYAWHGEHHYQHIAQLAILNGWA